jgi:hypothetical protein
LAQTRRGFLRNVGITGGAGVMFHTMGALGLAPADFEYFDGLTRGL